MVVSKHFRTIVIKFIFIIASRVEVLFFLIHFVGLRRIVVIVIVLILDLICCRSTILGIPILLSLRPIELYPLIADLLLLRVSP